MDFEEIKKTLLKIIPWVGIFLTITLSNKLWEMGTIEMMILSYVPMFAAIKILNHFYILKTEVNQNEKVN